MFFIKDDKTGREIGPLRKDQLFILHGIKAGSQVRTAEMTNYERAYLIPELELLFSEDEIFEYETGKKSTFLNRLKLSKFSVKDIIFLVLTGCVFLMCLSALMALGIWLVKNYGIVAQIAGGIVGFSIFGAIIYLISKVISDNKMVQAVFLSLIGIVVLVAAIMNPSIALIMVGCIIIPILILFVISWVLDINDNVAWAVLLIPVVASLLYMVERLLSGVLSGTIIGIVLGVLAAILACPLLAMYSQCQKDRQRF